jgi:hypothetical protein
MYVVVLLVIVVALVFWLVRNSRKRAQASDPPVAPPQSAESIIAEVRSTADASENGRVLEPEPEPNGVEPEVVIAPNGSESDIAELEDELRQIYERVGHPESFGEAKEKVTDLADQLVEEDGMSRDEALRAAYERSLTEHREYVATHAPA